MKKRTYTEKLHAYRVRCMLDKDDISQHCPAGLGNFKNDFCKVCRDFIKLEAVKELSWSLRPIKCPCIVLGCEEALKQTIKALEEYDARS